MAGRLFDGIAEPVDEADAADPAQLARVATLASGRAMRGRLWAEAKALVGLAESYARLAGRVELKPAPKFDEAAGWAEIKARIALMKEPEAEAEVAQARRGG